MEFERKIKNLLKFFKFLDILPFPFFISSLANNQMAEQMKKLVICLFIVYFKKKMKILQKKIYQKKRKYTDMPCSPCYREETLLHSTFEKIPLRWQG